jgi:predicted RNA-binding Zn-ribbon protein involved in translation (DUF1610 family)
MNNKSDCIERSSPPAAGNVIFHRKKRALRLVEAPRKVLDAPPALVASERTIDYTCGRCGAVLLQADEGQVHGFLLRCRNCGSFNAVD